MQALEATITLKLLMRDDESFEEAERRLDDVLWDGLGNLADHHIDYLAERVEVIG